MIDSLNQLKILYENEKLEYFYQIKEANFKFDQAKIIQEKEQKNLNQVILIFL